MTTDEKTYPLVHLTAADLTFRLGVEKWITDMMMTHRDKPLTFATPEYKVEVQNALWQLVDEYDARLPDGDDDTVEWTQPDWLPS